MADNLKPCPFCGGKASLKIQESSPMWRADIICANRFYAIGCPARMEMFQLGYTKEETIDKITKRWNARPNPWHTGTPTDEGEYICWAVFPKDICKDYEGSWKCKWKNGKWFDAQIGNNLSMDSISVEIIAWQKIEPYKENDR